MSVEWQSTDVPGHYGGHPRPQVADMGTPSSMDKRVAPDEEGAADKQCLGEGKLLFQTGADRAGLAFLWQVYLGEGKPQAQTLALQVGLVLDQSYGP